MITSAEKAEMILLVNWRKSGNTAKATHISCNGRYDKDMRGVRISCKIEWMLKEH
jgi:hypothetical protein